MHFKMRKRKKLKYYFSKRNRMILKCKIKNFLQYFRIRYLIGTTQRYLALMVLFSVGFTTAAFREFDWVHVMCFFGMLQYFMLYVKVRRFYSEYKIYKYYEVKITTGTIHMRTMDLSRIFAGKPDEEVKSLLIKYSYNDFMEIFKDYKDSGCGTRAIQTHKTFLRPFMKALRDNELVDYKDCDLERFITEAAECDGIDFEECFVSGLNGYRVQLKYIGCFQNKMIALRCPVYKCLKKYLHKFSISIPYYEVRVDRC